VTTQVAEGDADRYGVVQTDGERITDYVLKPENPRGNQVSNEIFVFDPKPAMELLERLAEDADPDEGIQDLGHQLLPALVSQGCARGHPFEGYWRDVGTLEAYHGAHMDLLGADPGFVLDALDWPLLTRGGRRGPSRALHEARLYDVLVSPSTTVSGTIERSVLSPGVVVEPGAVVRDSVLLHDVVVRAGAFVQRAIVDAGAEIAQDAHVGGADGLVLIGSGQQVHGRRHAGQHLPARPRSA